jgi:hypothetical protein
MLDVYWKTSLGGHTVRAGHGWAEERERWEDVVQDIRLPYRLHLDRCLLTYAIVRVAQVLLRLVKRVVFGIDESRTWPDDLRNPKAEYQLGRRMFTTPDEYIGLGPKGMISGDLIALFEGGKVPYVIRAEGEEYKLIGECYVHGMMCGESFIEARCQRLWLV